MLKSVSYQLKSQIAVFSFRKLLQFCRYYYTSVEKIIAVELWLKMTQCMPYSNRYVRLLGIFSKSSLKKYLASKKMTAI